MSKGPLIRAHGRVLNVYQELKGASIAAAAAIGATTLDVDNAADFDEHGGQLILGTNVYTYDVVNDDADSVHLTSGLVVAVTADDRANVYPLVYERWATVREDDAYDTAEGVQALVPFGLYASLPLGARDQEGEEWVTLEKDSMLWVVRAVTSDQTSQAGGVAGDGTLCIPGIHHWFEGGVLGVWDSFERFYAPFDLTVKTLRASLETVPTGADFIVEVFQNGTTSVGSITVAAGTDTAVIDVDVAMPLGDRLTYSIIQVGSTVPGSDLSLTVGWEVCATFATPAAPSVCDYDAAVLGLSPVAYYKLDETTGTVAIDYSGHGRDGTYHGSPTLGVPGPLSCAGNLAASFNEISTGQAAYVSLPAFPLNTDKATIVVFAGDVGSTNNELTVDLGTGLNKLQMKRDQGGGQRRVVDRGNVGGAFTDSPAVAGASGFDHWVYTVDRVTQDIDDWLNGVQHHNVGDGNTGNFWASDSGLLMKNNDGSGAVYCIGALGRVAIFDRVLSSAEIAGLVAAR